MTALERSLVSGQATAHRLTAPVERLDLSVREVLEMAALTAEDSGRVSGPKAANLGVLSQLFPGAVPPGLVIPFGVFSAHMEQPIPGGAGSYWQAVADVFAGGEGGRRVRPAAREVAPGDPSHPVP